MTPEIARLDVEAEIASYRATVAKSQAELAKLELQHKSLAAAPTSEGGGSFKWILLGLLIAGAWAYLQDKDPTQSAQLGQPDPQEQSANDRADSRNGSR